MKNRTRAYARAKLHKINKAHSRKRPSKGVDPLVFVVYVEFMEELMLRATRKARADGESFIAAKDIRKVTLSTLRRFRG